MPTCAFITLGCKVNQYDTQAVREDLARLGYEEVPASGAADLYIVNTCCVTQESHRKSLQHVRRIAGEHPGAMLIVTGCSVESDADEIRAIAGVRAVVGNEGKPMLGEIAANAARKMTNDGMTNDELRHTGLVPSSHSSFVIRHSSLQSWPSISRFAGHTRAFVKVEDGCNAYCSYCIVPYVRGRVRSRPPDEVVAEVQRLVANGYREVVLTGIHLGAYGRDAVAGTATAMTNDGMTNDECQRPEGILPPSASSIRHSSFRHSSLASRPSSPTPVSPGPEGPRFGTIRPTALVSLLEQIEFSCPGLVRLRLSSLELHEVTKDLAAYVAASRVVCPHFHIPLQSGDDAVLRAMNRRYTSARFLARLDAIRKRLTEPAITTDVIVGFPGETDEQFARTIEVARLAGFSRIHVFPYSDRKGTRASRMAGKLPPAAIDARRHAMLAVARELGLAYHQGFVGREVTVMVESQRDRRTGLLCGYSERYVRAFFDGPDGLRGQMATLRVREAMPWGVLGER